MRRGRVRWRTVGRAAAVLSLLAAGVLYVLRGPAPRPVEGGFEHALELGRERGKPVLVIMTGAW